MRRILKVAGILALGAIAGRSWATSADNTPLPPVETVVERALARAHRESENDRAFKANYHFTRSKTTEFKNVRGHVTKRKEKTTVNEPPARAASGIAEADTKSTTKTNAVSADTSVHKRDLLANTNLLNHFRFELRGREKIEGRSAFLVDFKPDSKNFPASNLKERCLSKVVGRVWVDEEDYALVKVEARLSESIGVVGGLVGAVHKFNFSFGRGRTEDGLWYTRMLTWHLEGREVIVERVIDCVETKTEVRKAQRLD